MKNAINLYRLAVALLTVALLMVTVLWGPALNEARRRADYAEADAACARKATADAWERTDTAESRLRAIEQGDVLPEATRKVIAEGAAQGKPFQIPGMDRNGVPLYLVKVTGINYPPTHTKNLTRIVKKHK